MDSYHLPPRRRPERTGPSYHNKVMNVAKQVGEGLVWGLPPPVSQVECHARADESLHHVRLRLATRTRRVSRSVHHAESRSLSVGFCGVSRIYGLKRKSQKRPEVAGPGLKPGTP